jgi:hypothetical protein
MGYRKLFAPHIEFVKSLDISEDDKERVYCLNAIDVFRLRM